MFTLLLRPSAELLPKGSKEEQRDYVFYLAVGNYRLKVRWSGPFSRCTLLGWAAPPARCSSGGPPEPWPPGRLRRAVGGLYRGAG